jgi:hypothetical protein
MLSFSKGGASFPIFPTMHIVTYLAAAIWVFPQLGVIAIRDKTSAGPFCAGLAILMGLLILPAMGRCDDGHVFFNSLALFIIAISAATWLAPNWSYTLIGAYALIFPALDMVCFWDHYKDPIDGALEARRQLIQIPYSPDNHLGLPPGAPAPVIHYSKLLPMSAWLNDLPKIKMSIPLGADEATERFLLLTGRLNPVYHIAPYFDIFAPGDLPREYADLRAEDYILIPKDYVGFLQPVNEQVRMRMQGEADCKFLSGLLLFPVDLPAVHPLFRPFVDIMHQIAKDYGVVKQYPNMLLLKRKQ